MLMRMNLFFLHRDIYNCDAYLRLLLGDCSARNAKCLRNYITTVEETQLETLTITFRSKQLIDGLTHVPDE